MAEGRMLKKNISISEKFAALKSDTSRMLWMMILPHLDIKGRFHANPAIVKGIVVPLLRLGIKKIQDCLRDLDRVGLITLYEIKGQKYLQFTDFEKYQLLRPEREAKSAIPAPFPALLPECSSTTPAQVKISKDKLSKDNKREENNIKEEKEKLLKKIKL